MVRELLAAPEDGRVKLFTLWRGLSLRRTLAALFKDGTYEPVRVEGSGAACVFAFMRRLGPDAALAILPVRAAPLFGSDYPLGQRWGDTRLVLPEESPDTPVITSYSIHYTKLYEAPSPSPTRSWTTSSSGAPTARPPTTWPWSWTTPRWA